MSNGTQRDATVPENRPVAAHRVRDAPYIRASRSDAPGLKHG